MSNEPLSASFGEIIRARRSIAGLTQEQLAERAGVHHTYVGLVERGKRNPTLDVAQRFAEALESTLSELISLAEKLEKAGTGRLSAKAKKGELR